MRYFIAWLVVITLIIFGVIIFGGNKKKAPKPVVITPKTLHDYSSTGAEVRLTVDGRIIGDDTHRTVRITIGRDLRKVEVLQGYQGNVIQSQSLYNNDAAYDIFLRAINNAGFTKERKTTFIDDRGVCPQGNRYIYELINTDKNDTRRWSATCSGVGTFGGQSQLVRTLFQAQITDYNKFIIGVQL